MDLTALLLSRLQFAFTVSFHIIFPSFTIGLAAWLTVLEALSLWTGRPAYRLVFEFWLKIFGVAFGLGVVSGIVMAFQFGTNVPTRRLRVHAYRSNPFFIVLTLAMARDSKPKTRRLIGYDRRGARSSSPRSWPLQNPARGP